MLDKDKNFGVSLVLILEFDNVMWKQSVAIIYQNCCPIQFLIITFCLVRKKNFMA